MSVFGEHHVSVTIARPLGNIRLEVSRLSLAMDEEWIPYIQADIECPLGDGSIASLNPQGSDIWATVEIRRTLGRVDRISDMTLRYRGLTLAAISSAFDGGTLADITRSLYHDYTDPSARRREETRTWRLMLRSMSVNQKAATVSFELASGEARLTDWQHMSVTSDRVPGANLIMKVNWILALAGFGEGLTYFPDDVPTDPEIGDEALRAPGSTALDFLTGLTRKHGLMLWCDEFGLWHLAENRTRGNQRNIFSFGDDRSVVNEVSKRSRDDGWITVVMLVYTWGGEEHYDIYPQNLAPNPEKALILRYNRPFPGVGMAEEMYKQVQGRGRALELIAVSQYAATPGETIRYRSPREYVSGRLAAVRWNLPEDQMSIRLREVSAA
jgi:hypothetical protein